VTRLRYLTAGESHGPALVGILEGLPSGVPIDLALIDRDLARRQMGYGRGGRMKIEKDAAELVAGVRFGRTLGSPVAVLIRNKDFAAWTERMKVESGGPDPRPVTVPRPGHTDLAGGLKYGHTADLRNVLERASARETAVRVALGGIARAFLRDLGIQIGSYVRSIGAAQAVDAQTAAPALFAEDAEGLALLADRTETRALDEASSKKLMAAVDEARKRRDTLGGILEVVATGVPIGLGSHVQWDRKLDGRLARALMAVPAMKAVEIGDGFGGASRFGSEVHDPLFLKDGRLVRSSNNAGGLEGGITNGTPLWARVAMKPIATVSAALPSVDLGTLEAVPAHVERSDTCAVPAAGVIAEAVFALELADAVLEALGGDTMDSLRVGWARMRLAARTHPGHVFLLGPMGVGKTAVGVVLARSLGLPFVDLDARIEAQAGRSVAELFKSQGEPAFRELERQLLTRVCAEPASVVSLGGGAVLNEEAWRKLRHHGVAVYLSARPEALAERIRASGRPLEERPLLATEDPVGRLVELAAARERWYQRADLRVDTEQRSADDVAGMVRGMLAMLDSPLRRGRGGEVSQDEGE
jgi:chorismate synthase